MEEVFNNRDSDIIVFPELALCGYPPEDLVLNADFQVRTQNAVKSLAKSLKAYEGHVIFGAPNLINGEVFNAAYIVHSGHLNGIYHKSVLPNYGVFDEKRTFTPGVKDHCLVQSKGHSLGLAICEDIWSTHIPQHLKEKGADALISINASPWRKSVEQERINAFSAWSHIKLPHVFVNQVGGQDELVFDGASFFKNPGEKYEQIAPQFEAKTSRIHFGKNGYFGLLEHDKSCRDLMSAEEALYTAAIIGLRDYVNKNNFPGVMLGLSGGMDSAICAAIAVDALGPDRVQSVMMPYKYTADSSIFDARECADLLGIQHTILPIEHAKTGIDVMLENEKTKYNWALADENIQSRIRGLALMSLSNASGHMVITTGNKSEIAVGYATLYGDMCGGYNPIKDLWKTEVFALARWRNNHTPRLGLGPDGVVIPNRIIEKPPSAELRPDQRDTDSLPNYDILDAILVAIVEENQTLDAITKAGYDQDMVTRVNRLLRRSEYKRRQSAPGPKLSSVSFGKDWRYPITNKFFP